MEAPASTLKKINLFSAMLHNISVFSAMLQNISVFSAMLQNISVFSANFKARLIFPQTRKLIKIHQYMETLKELFNNLAAGVLTMLRIDVLRAAFLL